MNGPARAMGALEGDPEHLMRWRQTGLPDELIPRSEFARYLRELAGATARDNPNVRFERAEIVQIVPSTDGYALRDRRGSAWRARMVVLATGNALPGGTFLPDAVRAHPRYFGDPWRFDGKGVDGDTLLIGSGLTAMDTIATLRQQSFHGRIHVVSRHGCLPLLEDPAVEGMDPSSLFLDTSTPYALLRTMRSATRDDANRGGDWRRIVDSIRKISPEIWGSWSSRERRRFLRHLQAYWSIHRYRVPAETMNAFTQFNSTGRLLRYRGAVKDVRILPEHFIVAMERAGERSRARVSYIVNCTGPESDYLRIARPLVRDLLCRGLIRPDALRLGIDATSSFNVIGAHGEPWPNLFTLGPPLRGLWYETTGVPEVRAQAHRLAQMLVALASAGRS